MSGCFRINCRLSNDINSDLFFNYQDNLSKKDRCKYDILDGELRFKDLKNIKKVLNELRFNRDSKPIILKGRLNK
jgi:hypothetical protein